LTTAFSCAKEELPEANVIDEVQFVTERTDDCSCTISVISASGIESDSTWQVYLGDPNPIPGTAPFFSLGGGTGSGSVSSNTLPIPLGINFIGILYNGENEDARFDLQLSCEKEGVTAYEIISFTWSDGAPYVRSPGSPPSNIRTFTLFTECTVKCNCRITAVSATGVNDNRTWNMFYLINPVLFPPFIGIGGGLGSGPATSRTPIQVDPGQHTILINVLDPNPNPDAVFTMRLECAYEENTGVSWTELFEFTWSDGELAPPTTFPINGLLAFDFEFEPLCP